MKLLALETANEQCSISLVDETQELFFSTRYAGESTNPDHFAHD